MARLALFSLIMAFLSVPAGPVRAAPPVAPKVVLQAGHQDGADIAAWTPDGRFLLTAAADDSSLIIWNTATGLILDHLRIPAPTRYPGDAIDSLISFAVAPDTKSS